MPHGAKPGQSKHQAPVKNQDIGIVLADDFRRSCHRQMVSEIRVLPKDGRARIAIAHNAKVMAESDVDEPLTDLAAGGADFNKARGRRQVVCESHALPCAIGPCVARC
jgi:hypothetical protein